MFPNQVKALSFGNQFKAVIYWSPVSFGASHLMSLLGPFGLCLRPKCPLWGRFAGWQGLFQLWKALHSEVHLALSLTSFRHQVEIYLFSQAFDGLLCFCCCFIESVLWVGICLSSEKMECASGGVVKLLCYLPRASLGCVYSGLGLPRQQSPCMAFIVLGFFYVMLYSLTIL